MTDLTNRSITLLSDIIEPVSALFSNGTILAYLISKRYMAALKLMLETNPEALVRILAAVEGTPTDEYDATASKLLRDAMVIMKDKYLSDFFASLGKTANPRSGSHTENIKGKTE